MLVALCTQIKKLMRIYQCALANLIFLDWCSYNFGCMIQKVPSNMVHGARTIA